MSNPVSVRFDSAIVRTALAKATALDLAEGNQRRLRPQPDGSVYVVHHPDFDMRSWSPERKGKKKNKS